MRGPLPHASTAGDRQGVCLEAVVHIVDADPEDRQRNLDLVRSFEVECIAHGTAQAMVEAFDPMRTACLVSELQLPDSSALAMQRMLAQQALAPPLVIVSDRGNTKAIVRAMRSGALTYLSKPLDEDELSEAVREALQLDQVRRTKWAIRVEMRERIASLSDGEREVLERMLQGDPNKVIAASLGVSLRTVEARRQQIFRKTDTDNLAVLARYVTQSQCQAIDCGMQDCPSADLSSA